MILTTISNDPAFHSDVRAALETRYRFEAVWMLSYDEAARVLGVEPDQKCVTIIDFANDARALAAARTLSGRPQVTTIAVGYGNNREDLLVLMQAGVRDALPRFGSRDLLNCTNRALAALEIPGEIKADLYAFVPAKPGCGASTVATYASGMAAHLADEPTLLLDFDLRLGVTTFLLKAEGTRTIVDALDRVDRLDRDVWSSLVAQIGNLHLLGSGANDFSRTVPPERFRGLLDFAVRQYSLVTVDLPGAMEEYECEVLMRSKGIILVCTPDIGALHVARRKSQWFRDLRMMDKVSVVLNSTDARSSLSVKEIETIIGLPVRYLLPASTKDVARAVQKGEILDQSCALGRQILAIAKDLLPARSTVSKPSAVRRFVEYFSVSPTRNVRSA
jgi:Flp pilus assembly CpaE family ATPase